MYQCPKHIEEPFLNLRVRSTNWSLHLQHCSRASILPKRNSGDTSALRRLTGLVLLSSRGNQALPLWNNMCNIWPLPPAFGVV